MSACCGIRWLVHGAVVAGVYVGPRTVCQMYGLDPDDCWLASDAHHADCFMDHHPDANQVRVLGPRADGDYTLE